MPRLEINTITLPDGNTYYLTDDEKANAADVYFVEPGDTATNNIPSGRYVKWKGTMCMAISDIAVGDTITQSTVTPLLPGGAANDILRYVDTAKPDTSSVATAYNPNWTYMPGAYCMHGIYLYRAKQFIETETWTASHWEKVGIADEIMDWMEGLGILPYMSSITSYSVGNYCIYDGEIMRCISAVAQNESWDSTKWESAHFSDFFLKGNVSNSLTDTSTTNALSAAKGKALSDAIAAANARIDALDPDQGVGVFKDVTFSIASSAWTADAQNGVWTYTYTSTDITQRAGVEVFYDSTLRSAIAGDIFIAKNTGNVVFTTNRAPIGTLTGTLRIIDSIQGYVTIDKGGTSATTAAAARTNLGCKGLQTAVTSPTASGSASAFIDTITQNENGEITSTKKYVYAAGIPMSSSDSTSVKQAMHNSESIAPKCVDTSAQDADLDITDTSGNVILRLEDGHIKTKAFDSEDVLDDLAGKQDELTFDDEPTEGSDNPVTSGGVYSAIENAPKDVKVDPTDASGVDLDITDESGNVVMRLENGYIKTKKFDSTDPFEVPSYYPAYLDSKCARIRELMKNVGGNGDAFIFCTDQHMDNNSAKNTHHSFKLIRYIAEKCRINKLFCGGDLQNGGNEAYADEFRKAMNGRCYMINGNHEYLDNGKDTDLAYWYTSGADDEIGDPDRRYFYVDNPKNMVRYIVLNGYDEAATQGGAASRGYEQAQLTWLTATAMNVPSGWCVVILTHVFWAVNDMTTPVLSISSANQTILDSIDTACTTYGIDAYIIQGHTHLDGIRASTGGIPVLITTCDKWQKANGEGYEPWLHNRTPGTVSEQAFDVCVLDKVNRKITAVRIGGFNTGNDNDDEALTEIGERVIQY